MMKSISNERLAFLWEVGMEKKQRTTIWISQDVMKELDRMSENANCRSRSEFIEKAIRFYDGYLRSTDENQYLPVALSSAMNGIIHTSEDRIARVIYKNTVELSMMMNILAATAEIDEETLKKLRRKCIREVNGTKGQITFEDAYHYQKN